jgi:hypothetical protein
VLERQGSHSLAFEGFGLCCLVGIGLWMFLLFFGFWACGSSLCMTCVLRGVLCFQ